jgi:glycosyltransferase involved in cell wall biosynthesis
MEKRPRGKKCSPQAPYFKKDSLNYSFSPEPDLTGKRTLLLFPHMVLPGGALNYMLNLADLLRQKGATVGILTLQAESKLTETVSEVELLTIGGPVTSHLGYWLLFPYWQRKINGKIRVWSPDVLVPQVFPANWWAWLYKKKYRKTAIVWICHEPSAFIHSRNWINALQPSWKRYLARLLNPLLTSVDIRLSRFSDKIVANSKFTVGMIERIYHLKADAVASPAIDSKVFHPADNIKKQDAIVTVALLSRFKRVDFLLRVFAQLLIHRPQLVYHIVGRGEEEERLKDLAAKLHVSSRVRFHGGLDNDQLAALFRSSKLFLNGSVEEPFGMAPLEAIACNTPVVAHRSGGPLEFVNDSCGRLVDSLSEEGWSREIDDFLSMLETTPDYFLGVSANVRKFSWESTLAPILGLIADCAPSSC